MSSTLTNLATDSAGIQITTDYAGAANPQARVQLLIDLISLNEVDGTSPDRGFLDEMSHPCRVRLYAELVQLKANVPAI